MIRNVICTLIGLPLLIYAGYAVILGLFTFRRRPPIPRAQRDSRLCVLCPARNEEAVIGTLIDSLLAQNYPRDRFDIYVLPNHCTDRTEQIARARGARILPIGEDVRTKGDVLRQAFERLRAAHYDAFVIFDADNIVHPDFLARVNDALCAGYDVVQGYRDSKNPQDTWISGDCSIYYWLLNTFFYRARMNIGASSGLNGTGMGIGALSTSLGIAGYTYIMTPWVTPPVLGALLSTGGSVGAALTAVVILVVAVLIYMPFVKAMDREVEPAENEGE